MLVPWTVYANPGSKRFLPRSPLLQGWDHLFLLANLNLQRDFQLFCHFSSEVTQQLKRTLNKTVQILRHHPFHGRPKIEIWTKQRPCYPYNTSNLGGHGRSKSASVTHRIQGRSVPHESLSQTNKKQQIEDGRMAQQLRVFAALSKDLRSVPVSPGQGALQLLTHV